jgi:diadenosine tetraphosphate (Ap4A) HIT family hydrolase
MDPNCIFCKILDGQIPASIVYRDDQVMAFLDIHPSNPGHTLVIPVRHAERLADLMPDDGGHIFRVGQRIASALYGIGVQCEGVNFYLADGVAANQEVGHIHLHVVPRYSGDKGFLRRGRMEEDFPRDELNRVAEALRALLLPM